MRSSPHASLRRLGSVGWPGAAALVLAGQLAWLITQSVTLDRHFDLTSDFALFFQAWHQIGGGHLDPTGTIYRQAPFLTNHFELILYPLSLFSLVSNNAFTLLILQDVACVLAEWVAFAWLREVLGERWPAGRSGRDVITAGGLVVLAIDPWIFWANAFDVHLEVFAALFVTLAGRAFWNRRRSAWLWVALTLLCGTVEAIALIGLGLTLLLLRPDLRLRGLAVLGGALAWVGALSGLGYDAGSQLNSQYAYLTNPALLSNPGRASATNVSLLSVVAGALRHPRTVGRFLVSRRTELWRFVAGSGGLGVASWIGVPMCLVLLVPGALNYSPYVLNPQSAFQVLPLLLFVPVGSAAVLCWLVRRGSTWRWVGIVLGVAALVEVVVLAALWIPRAEPYFARVDAPAAHILDGVLTRTSPSTEVVASNGVVGRFAARPWIYAYLGTAPSQRIDVAAKTVEFVFAPSQGIETACPAAYSTDLAIGYVERTLGARLVQRAAGIDVLVWHPRRLGGSIRLPVLPPVLPPGAKPCV